MNAGNTTRTPSFVDRENPWPGLESFTEDSRAFFFGREVETDQLSRLVSRQTLTVLFGQSGLGKSSLLQAGLFPILRESDHLPLYLRLDHAPNAAELVAQVKLSLNAAFAAAGADAPAFSDDETLWEYFHRKDVDIWSAKNRLLTPVLAFDQFEEIFTLGRADEACRERSRVFLSELACLVENRPPPAVKARLNAGGLDPAKFNFEKPSCQVILSLREDFLPDLEGLKQEMPALIHNRLRLKKLSGTQALEIVSRPAPHLLAEGVAERIVEFVAGGRGGSAERLAEFDVEPPLLSVICRELNDRRRSLGLAQITPDLVSGNRREILTGFYERSVADLPEDMRTFVEDHLLTKSGFRDNLALETAFDFPGVTRELIDTLVGRRLLRIEDRFGVQRVELTHDVLADVIRGSRDARQQRIATAAAARHTRRLRWVVAGLALVVLGLSVGAVFGIRAQRLAAERASRTDLAFASQLMEHGDAAAAIARIVRAARSDPGNPVTGSRLLSALAQKSWPIWQDTGIRLASPARSMVFLPDGKSLLVGGGEDGVIRVLDAATLNVTREFKLPSGVARWAVAPDNSSIAAAFLEDGSLVVIDLAAGEVRIDSDVGMTDGGLTARLALSRDGRLLAFATQKQIALIDVAGGSILSQTVHPEVHNPSSVNFSRDSTRLIVTDWSYGVEIRRVPDGAVVLPWMNPNPFGSGSASAGFSPDGKSFAVAWFNGAAVFDTATGNRIGHYLIFGEECYSAMFDESGSRVITSGVDRTVRAFDPVTQEESVPPMVHGAIVVEGEISRDDRTLMTVSVDGFVHLWDTSTGAPKVEPTLNVPQGTAIALDPDGQRVLFVAPDGRIMTLDAISSAVRPLRWMPPGPGITLGDGSSFAMGTYYKEGQSRTVSHLADSGFHDLSLDTGRVTKGSSVLPPKGTIYDWDSEQSTFLSRSAGNEWSVWKNQGQGLEKSVVLQDTPEDESSVWVFGDNDLVLFRKMQGSSIKSLRLWHLSDGRPAGPEIAPPTLIVDRSFSVSPDQTRLTLAQNGGHVGIWEITSGREIVQLKTDFPAGYPFVRFSPDGRTIATGTYLSPTKGGGQHAEARLWDAQTGESLSPAYSHTMSIYAVSFSSDSRLVMFASGDGTVDIVSTANGRPVCPRLALPGTILSNNGARFFGTDTIFTSSRSLLLTWDAHSGLPLTEPIQAGSEAFNRFRIDPSGTSIATIGTSGLTEIWPLPPRYHDTPVPDWLLRLATTLAAVRLDDNGNLVPAEGGFVGAQAELTALRMELAALPDNAPYVEWGRWFLADRATRGIAPGFTITPEEADKLAAPSEAP